MKTSENIDVYSIYRRKIWQTEPTCIEPIGMIERAEKNITLVNIQKIADALEVNIEDLVKISNSGKKTN